MKPNRRDLVSVGVIGAAGLIGLGALAAWLRATPSPEPSLRVPIGEAAWEAGALAPPRPAVNPGTLLAGRGRPSADTGRWPQFRGPRRDNIWPKTMDLASQWPAAGWPVVWKLEVGEGHAGVAIDRGRVYLIDYDRQRQEDAIRCLSLADGAEIWRYTYSVPVKRNHGMSRTVPAVSDRFVVAIGPKCHVHCLEAPTGRLVWKLDLVRQFGTTVPPWYAGQCALIDAEAAILAPGGRALLMAVELATGRIRWQTPNPDGWQMTHSSVMPMDRPEGRQYLYAASGGVVGVAADTGQVLWKWDGWRIRIATVPSPVVIDSERVFLSGGYNAGCCLVRLVGQGTATRVQELWRLPARVFGAEQHTPIFYNGYLYGVIPSGELVCLGLDGRVRWSSGPPLRFGLGPYFIADGRLWVLNDQEGTLHAFAAVPEACRLLGRAKVFDGHDAWAPMALADGRLILRDLTQLMCLDLRERSP